jgi:hypothetical protein
MPHTENPQRCATMTIDLHQQDFTGGGVMSDEEDGLTCVECGRELPDDEDANVMVDEQAAYSPPPGQPKQYLWLRVYCKPCTRKIDDEGSRRRELHNLWELRWIRATPVHLMVNVLMDLAQATTASKWTPQALSDFAHLLLKVRPDLARGIGDIVSNP